MEEAKIRYAENKDFCWLKKHDNHIHKKILKAKIENREVYIVEHGTEIIGWLRYNLFWDSVPFMNMIYFLEEYRRKGLGTKMVKYWKEDMRRHGYTNVLTSTQSNEEAQIFYRKMGYIEIGGFNFFDDPYEIIFHKIF